MHSGISVTSPVNHRRDRTKVLFQDWHDSCLYKAADTNCTQGSEDQKYLAFAVSGSGCHTFLFDLQSARVGEADSFGFSSLFQ